MQDELTRESIRLGHPLPWDLQNKDGMVVFRKGFVVTTEASLQMMLNMDLSPRTDPASDATASGIVVKDESRKVSRPVFPSVDTEKGLAPLAKIDRLADELAHCCTQLCKTPGPAADAITGMAAAARKLFAEHSAACIAAIHFRHNKPASCLHPLYSLFLTELLSPAFGGADCQSRLSYAALTANLGMYEFQDQWANQQGPLTDEQKQQVRNHPEASVQRLKIAGIDDPLWFAIVRQHHERADGSGYPRGLSGDEVLNEALLLGLIDRYLSFVMPRVNRKWVHPTAALKMIHGDAASYRERNINIFIKRLGVYPPGTSVRLSNGEIAVVTHHQIGRSAHPGVVSVGTAANEFFDKPVQRDTTRPEYAIKGLYVPDLDHEANPALMVRSWL